MTPYQRIFGTGPRGFASSLVLLGCFAFLDRRVGPVTITSNDAVRYALFGVLTLATVALLVWSVQSLPPADRGRRLVVQGAFRYFRHPLYAAFLTFFDFGLAVLLNSWLYVAWALLLHPLWHLNIRGEEALMQEQFPDAYDDYRARTGRFVPRWSR